MGGKLYFYYSAMNAGKSTVLIQSAYNYTERGMHVLVFCPDFDKREAEGVVASRIGLKMTAEPFSSTFDFLTYMQTYQAGAVGESRSNEPCACVFIDEAQFLKKAQVKQLSQVADQLNIPVLCYGLRSDFQGEPFEGSKYLLSWADRLNEVKTICHCGSKATCTARMDSKGKFLLEGESVEIGGNERYTSFCRKHHPAFQLKVPVDPKTPTSAVKTLKRRPSGCLLGAEPDTKRSKELAKVLSDQGVAGA